MPFRFEPRLGGEVFSDYLASIHNRAVPDFAISRTEENFRALCETALPNCVYDSKVLILVCYGPFHYSFTLYILL